jgi:hypothetical protein
MVDLNERLDILRLGNPFDERASNERFALFMVEGIEQIKERLTNNNLPVVSDSIWQSITTAFRRYYYGEIAISDLKQEILNAGYNEADLEFFDLDEDEDEVEPDLENFK